MDSHASWYTLRSCDVAHELVPYQAWSCITSLNFEWWQWCHTSPEILPLDWLQQYVPMYHFHTPTMCKMGNQYTDTKVTLQMIRCTDLYHHAKWQFWDHSTHSHISLYIIEQRRMSTRAVSCNTIKSPSKCTVRKLDTRSQYLQPCATVHHTSHWDYSIHSLVQPCRL